MKHKIEVLAICESGELTLHIQIRKMRDVLIFQNFARFLRPQGPEIGSRKIYIPLHGVHGSGIGFNFIQSSCAAAINLGHKTLSQEIFGLLSVILHSSVSSRLSS